MISRTVTLSIAAIALALCGATAEARVSAPTNLNATAETSSTIELTWSDSNDNVVGFIIERSLEPKRRFAAVATTDGDVRRYVDTGLKANTAYYYRLRTLQENRSSTGTIGTPRKSKTSKIASDVTFPVAVASGTPTPAPTSTPTPGGSTAGWSKRFGGSGEEFGSATAVGADGSVVVAGRFTGSASFGGSTLASAGGLDCFVAKYNPSGAHVWSKRFGGSGSDVCEDVAIDAAGNVVLVGSFEDSVNFGGGSVTSAGWQDAFVVKYSPTGSHVSTARFGGTQGDRALAVAVDGGGNVIVGGSFMGTVSFGGTSPLRTAGSGVIDLFVAKLAGDGSHVWSRNFQSNYSGEVRAIATDSTGRIALTGYIAGAADFGGGQLWTSQSSRDAFVAMLGSNGSHVWSRHFGASYEDTGEGVAIDGNGNVVAAGRVAIEANMGGGNVSADGSDMFVAKYSASGAHVWSRVGGGRYPTDAANDVAIGPNNSVVVTGFFSDAANFGGATVDSAGDRDAFIAQYNQNGGLAWADGFGGTTYDGAFGVAVGPAGNIVATGGFSGTGYFEIAGLVSAGGLDGFVMVLEP